jgi:hypothetical protein
MSLFPPPVCCMCCVCVLCVRVGDGAMECFAMLCLGHNLPANPPQPHCMAGLHAVRLLEKRDEKCVTAMAEVSSMRGRARVGAGAGRGLWVGYDCGCR